MNDRMTVGAGTRFRDIYQRFRPTGRGHQKHIRFGTAKGLYLSQKASMGKIKDLITFSNQRMQARMDKRAEGAATIRAVIDGEYGQGYAERIFRRVQEQHGVQLDRGVRRADLDLIDAAIQRDEQLSAKIPEGMQIDADGNVSGRSTITHLAETPEVKLEAALQEKAVGLFHPPECVNVAGQLISGKAKDDMPRMQFEIQVQGQAPFSTSGKDIGQTVDTLRAFAGSDKATTVLSAVLNQYILRPLHQNMQTSDGTHIDLRLSARHGPPVTLKTPEGEIIPIEPKQYGAANIKLSKDEVENFRVNIEWPLHFTGMRTRADGQTTALPLHENGVLRATFTTSWVINASEAAEGRLDMAVDEPLQVSYYGKLT